MKRKLIHNIPLTLFLIFVWHILWGHISGISITTGIIISVVLVYLFSNKQKVNLNPLWLMILIIKMLFWIIHASINLAITVLRPSQPTPSIIKIKSQLPTKILHIACLLNVLIPGTIVVRASRKSKNVYLHVLDCNTIQKATKAQRDFSQLENILAKTFGYNINNKATR